MIPSKRRNATRLTITTSGSTNKTRTDIDVVLVERSNLFNVRCRNYSQHSSSSSSLALLWISLEMLLYIFTPSQPSSLFAPPRSCFIQNLDETLDHPVPSSLDRRAFTYVTGLLVVIDDLK
jgi:hypothetical protein